MSDPRERRAKMAGAHLTAFAGLPVMLLVTAAFIAYAEGFAIVAGIAGLLAFGGWLKMIQYAGGVGERTANRVKEIRRDD